MEFADYKLWAECRICRSQIMGRMWNWQITNCELKTEFADHKLLSGRFQQLHWGCCKAVWRELTSNPSLSTQWSLYCPCGGGHFSCSTIRKHIQLHEVHQISQTFWDIISPGVKLSWLWNCNTVRFWKVVSLFLPSYMNFQFTQ